MPLTVQGFEYEYTAIIWDEDLYYDKKIKNGLLIKILLLKKI